MEEKQFYVIFGAQMVNKGAQAMLFVTVSEIRKRDPQAKIIVFIYDEWKSEENPDIYNMKFVPITMKHIMNLSKTAFGKAYVIGKRAKIKKKSAKLAIIDYILSHAKAAFDISGYALSNQWGMNTSLFYLSKFELLHQYGVPTYVMPQSFGPFDYYSCAKNAIMHSYIKKYLSYPELIFAREQEGYDALTNEIGLHNVKLSNDLVLQNKSIKITDIYTKTPNFQQTEIADNNNVAIIPNSSNEKHGNRDQLLDLYRQLIEKFTAMGKNIYLLAHSSQDLGTCREIIDNCDDISKIALIEADLNCIEYGIFIRKFDYIIASRFHSIVNAFKEHIPCIALGWAIKYGELLDLLEQKQFNFDVRYLQDFGAFMNAVDVMEKTHEEQALIIQKNLQTIQEKPCFQFLDDIIPKREQIRNVSGVVDEDMCTGCGICKAVCPKDCVSFEYSNGMYTPRIDMNKCINCRKCLNICPGRGFDYIFQWGEQVPDNKLAGECLGAYSARVKCDNKLERSTSGGCVTQIVISMLETQKYDIAFCVDTYSYGEQVLTKGITSPDKLEKTPKSRYIPVAQTEAIKYIIENPDKKVVFVGTSCFVHGLLNVIADYNLNRDNYLILGLFCDRTLNYNVWNYFNKTYCDGKISELYFRDKKNGGWPGNVTCITEKGTLKLPSTSRTDIKDYFQISGCLYCYDKLNQFADISFGDDYANREKAKSKNGSNSIIIRTELGMRVWTSVSELLDIEEDSFEKLIKGQHLGLRKNNHTFELLNASTLSVNNGFHDMPYVYLGIVDYENRKKKIEYGRADDFDIIRREIQKKKKKEFIIRIKRKVRKITGR